MTENLQVWQLQCLLEELLNYIVIKLEIFHDLHM